MCSTEPGKNFFDFKNILGSGFGRGIFCSYVNSLSAKGQNRHSHERDEDMRKYEEGQEKKLTEVVCNRCGRKLKVENGYLREDCVAVDKSFGYFSRKDGVSMHFDLCEECYDELTAQFAVPAETNAETELL